MSVNQMRQQVDSLILHSGMKADVKMCCSLMKTLKMRHGNIDTSLARSVIRKAIQEHL